MADKPWDILVIGGTGYTGKFLLDYLKTQKSSLGLRVCLGGRSLDKIAHHVKGNANWSSTYLDITDEPSVTAAVQQTHVVISLAGPWWAHGESVVRACARHGVHYLDLTGETHWVAKMIDKYDYLAHKNRACMIPCAGYDSIPSDLAVYLSTKTLEKRLRSSVPLSIKSNTAVKWKIAGFSGGSMATILSRFDEVPRQNWNDGVGWNLSPVPGPPSFAGLPRLLYSLPHVYPTVYGGFFMMSLVNESNVRRSWGLQERQRREQAVIYGVSPWPAPTFSYEEFIATSGIFSGIMKSLQLFLGDMVLRLFPPARNALRKIKSGEGPPVEKAKDGWFELTNVSEANGVVARSVVKGDGDPAYYLTAWMIVECAILLFDPSNLTPLGREGGFLTATTAFGETLAPAFEATGKIETSSAVLLEEESKKTR